ncbi:MAG: tetratricopeptide repeat protein [Proteobacteria bacterium]|nr:tetratricopeptide repeat protein [Pseudomonadota bacterium]
MRFCPYHGKELKHVPDRQYQPGESVCGYYLKKHIGHDGLGDLFSATKGGNTYRFRIYSGPIICDQKRVSRLREILEKDFQVSGGGIPVADFDWGEDGMLYSAHPYIPGPSLRDIMRNDTPLNEDEIADLLFHLLRAVKDLHGQRFIHGNLSLSNIILDNSGRIRLHDIGIWDILRNDDFAALREDNPELLEDILDLMSPEVAKGEAPSHASDVYSCGAAACCLFSQNFDTGSLSERIQRHVSGDVRDLRSLSPKVRISDDFADLLAASMLGTSGVRFQTIRAFLNALLSIHPEIDENEDALAPALSDRLLNGAEKPNIFTADLEDKSFAAWAAPGQPDPEPTRSISSSLSALGSSSWDDIAKLVGDRLDSGTHQRLTPEMLTDHNTADASQETSSLSESNDVDPEIANALNSLTSAFDKLSSSVDLTNDEKTSDEITDEKIADKPEEKAEAKSDEITDEKIAANSEEKAEAKSDEITDEKIAANSEEKAEAKPDEITDEKIAANSEEKAEAKSDEITDEKIAANSEEKAEAKSDNTSGENTDTKSDDTASEAQNTSKPHKRIGRKTKQDSELENGDVVVLGDNKEARKIKKRRRRSMDDCEPQNEVVSADLEIKPLEDPETQPPYSKLPRMTVSAGYIMDEEDEKKPSLLLTMPAESNASASSRQPERVSKTNAQKRSLFTLVALLTICACVLMGIFLLHPQKQQTQQSKELSQPALNTKLEEFHALLAQNSPEARSKAIVMFRELRTANITQDEKKQCRKDLLQAFQTQADSLRKSAQKSDAVPNALDISLKLTDIESAFNVCKNSIAPDAQDTQALVQKCTDDKTAAEKAAKDKALADAIAQRPALEAQLDKWNELANIYEAMNKHKGGIRLDSLAEQLHEATSERQAFENRLIALNNAGTPEMPPQAALAQAQPAQPENAQEPAAQPENTQAQAEQPAGSAAMAAVEPQPTVAQPTQPALAQAQPAKPTQPAVDQPPVVQPQPTVVLSQPNVILPDDVMAKNDAPQQQAKPTIKLVDADLKPIETPKPAANKAQPETPKTAANSAQAAANPASAPKETPKANTASNTGAVPTGKLIADANLAMQKKDFATAASLLQQATKQDPSNSRAWLSLAKVDEAQGKLPIAASHAEKSCSISKTASCYVYLGNLRSKAGMTAEAQAAYRKALELDPNNAQAKAKLK